jgi:hypothetical protein
MRAKQGTGALVWGAKSRCATRVIAACSICTLAFPFPKSLHAIWAKGSQSFQSILPPLPSSSHRNPHWNPNQASHRPWNCLEQQTGHCCCRTPGRDHQANARVGECRNAVSICRAVRGRSAIRVGRLSRSRSAPHSQSGANLQSQLLGVSSQISPVLRCVYVTNTSLPFCKSVLWDVVLY